MAPVTLDQQGRVITIHNDFTPDEHAAVVEEMIGALDRVRESQSQLRVRLMEILQAADASDLIARLSVTYATIDPDVNESDTDRSPAHVEYLALQALGLGFPRREVDPRVQTEFTWEAIGIVRQLFDGAADLLLLESMKARRDAPDDPAIDFMFRTRLDSLGVRGAGYIEHLKRVLLGCLGPFDDACRQHIGFTAAEALAILQAIADLFNERIEPRFRQSAEAREELFAQLKWERRHRKHPDRRFSDEVLNLAPSKAKTQLSMMVWAWVYMDSYSIAVIRAEDLSEHSGIENSACEAFLKVLTCHPEKYIEEHHAYPGGAHPLTEFPVIKVDSGYMIPALPCLMDALRPRMEDVLKGTKVWERYADARGEFLEAEATKLLAGAIPGSDFWTGVEWARSSGVGSDLDGLVTADDLGIRLQCKGGRLTAPTRRGAPQGMRHNLSELVQDAAQQHADLAIALEQESADALGFSPDQTRALNAPIQIEAIVCLDDVTVWSTEAHRLRTLGTLPSDRPIPWVVSLTDLMAIVDLLEGSQLIHYLLRRQRIERDGRISAHDELDWVGHYIAEGLYFDRYFESEDAPHLFRLNTYTEPIDAWYYTREGARSEGAPKPTQRMPIRLGRLIKRLEMERPKRWVMAGLALMDGDDASRDQWEAALSHAARRVNSVGWSNATQLFRGRLGVTFYVDRRVDDVTLGTELRTYAKRKLQELEQPNWVAIGEGGNGNLMVVVLETDSSRRLIEVFAHPESIV